MRVVLVEWADPVTDGSRWQPLIRAGDGKPYMNISVGVLLDDGQVKVELCQSKNNEQFADRITIPKSAIKRIRQLTIKG